MRFGRVLVASRSPTVPPEETTLVPLMAGIAQRRMAEEYAKGLADGVRMAFDHIEGIKAGGVPYDGPMPDELRAYIARAREQM